MIEMINSAMDFINDCKVDGVIDHIEETNKELSESLVEATDKYVAILNKLNDSQSIADLSIIDRRELFLNLWTVVDSLFMFVKENYDSETETDETDETDETGTGTESDNETSKSELTETAETSDTNVNISNNN